MKKIRVLLLSLVVPAFLLGGCASLPTGVPVLSQLSLEAPSSIQKGEVATLEAVGYDANMSRIEVPGVVEPDWKVSDTDVCKLMSKKGASVKIKGLQKGMCFVTATQKDASKKTALQVK